MIQITNLLTISGMYTVSFSNISYFVNKLLQKPCSMSFKQVLHSFNVESFLGDKHNLLSLIYTILLLLPPYRDNIFCVRRQVVLNSNAFSNFITQLEHSTGLFTSIHCKKRWSNKNNSHGLIMVEITYIFPQYSP